MIEDTPSTPAWRRALLGIRARLLLLAIVVALPFLALAVWRARVHGAEQRLEAAHLSMLTSRLVAARIEERITQADILLNSVIASTTPLASATAANDSILARMGRDLPEGFSGLFVSLPDGGNIGTSFRPLSQRPLFQPAARRYFRDALRTKDFAVGEPVGAATDSTLWIVSLARPALGTDRNVRAVAIVTMQLDRLEPMLDVRELLPGSIVTLADERGRILGRSVDAAPWLGRDIRDDLGMENPGPQREGTERHQDAGGAGPRLTTFTTLRRAPWHAFVTTPEAALFAGVRDSAVRDVALILATTLVALVAALFTAGRISRPISALTADVTALGAGDLSRRSKVVATGEVGLLARQFNAMAERLDAHTQALRESDERHRELFTLSPLPMYVYDERSLQILAANDAAVGAYGWSHEDFLTLTARDLRPADHVAELENELRRRGGSGLRQRRMVHCRKDGTPFNVEVNVTRTTALGRRAVFAVVSDLTARDRTEAELRASQDQLRHLQKVEAVGSLASGIAHDFNNLLTAILGSCDMALASLPANARAREDLGFARDAALRATSLTKQLLSFSRPQASVLERVDVRSVVRGLGPMLQRTLGAQVTLTLTLAGEDCTVLADPTQLEQVVVNLLLNARDATPSGGLVSVAVSTAATTGAAGEVAAGHWALLSVSDTGCGMDDATIARMLEPFFTTKARGKSTGLGLAVVDSIVSNVGGKIAVASVPGRGTTVSVYLPLITGGAQRHPTPPLGTPAATGSETILLVEDDESVRRVGTQMLQKLGYEVLAASEPGIALTIARDYAGRVDLIFTDVMMPGMNGREMAEAMAPLRPGVPVVYASGYTDDTVLIRQLQESTAFFLQKPYASAALASMVRAALDARGVAPRPVSE